MLIAIMLAVLVGMAALAIDGSRAYALRRDLQAAVDAGRRWRPATRFSRPDSYVRAEQAATTSFGTNRRLYSGACLRARVRDARRGARSPSRARTPTGPF